MSAGFSNERPKAPWNSPDGTPVTTSELQAFAHESGELFGDGTPKDYYLPKWSNLLDAKTSRAGFNKAALFIGHIWCFWRKQWLLGLFVILVEFVLGFLFIFAAITAGASPESPAVTAMPWLGLIIVRLALAFKANRIYLRRAFRTIAAARRTESDERKRMQIIQKRGGTSIWGIVLGLGIAFVSFIANILTMN